MKNYIKGMITGILVGAVVLSVPAIAENIDVLFNTVRVNINGIDRIQWNEDIKLGDGTTTPSSILYNGTTYLPIRKISELMGGKVYWNGDSRTVSVTEEQRNEKNVAEKADKNGNMWKYYTFEDSDGKNFLGVMDEERGYERVYRIINNIMVTDNEIFFFKDTAGGGYSSHSGVLYPSKLTKLSFDNDENSQDGEELKYISYLSSAVFDDGYIYYAYYSPGNAPKGYYGAYNCATGENVESKGETYEEYINLQIDESTETKAVIGYNSIYTLHGINGGDGKFVFDKTTNSFLSPDKSEE